MTKVLLTKQETKIPFECSSIGDYFYFKGDLYIRTNNEYDVYGYAVRLKDGQKILFKAFEEIEVIKNIRIEAG